MMQLKKLIGKLLLIGLPFFIFFEGIYRVDPLLKFDIETEYIASIIDKQNSLKISNAPKIVLMGGSGTSYGICSDSIENRLKIPVFNQAIIFSFGIDFMLNQIESHLKKGDILVVSPEYMMSVEGDYQDQLKAARFLPEIKKHIRFKNFPVHLSSEIQFRLSLSKVYLSNFLDSQKNNYSIEDTINVFFRKGFNSKGDLISHLNNPPSSLTVSNIASTEKYIEVIDKLNQFDAKMKKKGVQLLFSYPSYFKSGYNLNKIMLKEIENHINCGATFKVIDSMEANIFEDSLFFDQGYHLNSNGRRIKSKALSINILKEINKRK